MKKSIAIFVAGFVLMTSISHAQTKFKEYKAGHIIYVSLPEYMNKTTGINSAASIQYKSTVKDVYGFVMEDNKEELNLADLHYASINEFYEEFIADFLKGEEDAKSSKPQYQKKGETNFVETDVVLFDKEAKTSIYYLIGIVETKTAYYKVLSWATEENKDKFKQDFQKILYSLKD
jgi:hypothetical protein